ncbi:MAG: AlpA family transcriptional regulator [Xanthomonadales bacterium]|nr:AlpA family transcriptional regulator [Xanthomonadales bacterium]
MSNLIRLPQVVDRTGLSRSSIYALAAKQQFPRPIRLTVATSAWIESEVDDWIAARVEASRRTPEDILAAAKAGDLTPPPSTARAPLERGDRHAR